MIETSLTACIGILGLLLGCSVGKTKGVAPGDTVQVEYVKKYVDPAPARPQSRRDTTFQECLNADCSEGINRYYIMEILMANRILESMNGFGLIKHTM